MLRIRSISSLALTTAFLFPLSGNTSEPMQYRDCLVEPALVVEVGSHAQGIIREIPVSRGDSIEQGQLLASLESDVDRVAVEIATARLEYLEDQYQRLNKLRGKNMVSAEDFDEIRIERNMASLDLERSQILLDQKSITSQVKGVVVSRLLSPGEYVHEQSPIMEIAQTDPLNVELLLPVNKYRDVKVGQLAEVILEEPVGGSYSARIKVIDRVLDAASSSFGVRLELPNPDLEIPAGIRCRVQFVDEASD
ncbi:MAG: efflux RND transporter periplasmic adaptor subunit [Halioglobus sp.]